MQISDNGVKLEADELATILAALRYYQRNGLGEPSNRPLAIHEIATDSDQVISLDDAGIDRLCEDINTHWEINSMIDFDRKDRETRRALYKSLVREHEQKKADARAERLEQDAAKARGLNLVGADVDGLGEARRYHGERIEARRKANSPW